MSYYLRIYMRYTLSFGNGALHLNGEDLNSTLVRIEWNIIALSLIEKCLCI